MKNLKLILLVFAISFVGKTYAQQKPALTWKDVSKWTFNRGNALSPDGQWMAWASGPTEGDLKMTIRKTLDTLSYSYPIGANASGLSFSKDFKYAAFKVSAKDAEAKAARKANKPLYDKLLLVSLADNKQTTFEKVRTFSFSGDSPSWIAIQFMAPEGAPKDPTAAKGTDVLLYNLVTKKSFNLGNVAEFSFNKAGDQFAYTVDANGQNGNGIFLRDMKTGITTALDNDKATYKSINWNEVGNAFALLKSNKDEKYKDDVFSIIGISKINGDLTNKVVYNGIEDLLSRKEWESIPMLVLIGLMIKLPYFSVSIH